MGIEAFLVTELTNTWLVCSVTLAFALTFALTIDGITVAFLATFATLALFHQDVKDLLGVHATVSRVEQTI